MVFQVAIGQFTFTKEDKERINPLIQKGVVINNDEHKGISWIKSKEIPIDIDKDITMSIYFGVMKKDGKIVVTPMRLVNDLNLSSWLFFDEVSILLGTRKDRVAGTVKRYLYKAEDPYRDARRGGVKEKSDDVASTEIMEFIRFMANTPKAFHIRYNGDKEYHEEFYGIFFKKFKKSFTPVLETYDALNREFGNTERLAVN